MEIHVTAATGTGPTQLAAFDAAALAAAGIHHNMIYLSSFIPPGGVVVRGRIVLPEEAWGQRVYVVQARADADIPGQEAWAGLGWVQGAGGRGMFVEHHGRSKGAVDEAIHATLSFMMARRSWEPLPIQSEVTGIRCEGQPVCALVMAVYEMERWAGGGLSSR